LRDNRKNRKVPFRLLLKIFQPTKLLIAKLAHKEVILTETTNKDEQNLTNCHTPLHI